MTSGRDWPVTGATSSAGATGRARRSRKAGRRRYHPASAAIYWSLLPLVFLGSALAGPMSRLELGGMTAQGLVSIVVALLSVGLFVATWTLRVPVERQLEPLAWFTVWVVVSLSWSTAWRTGAQNALVWTTFVALLFAFVRVAQVWHGLTAQVVRLLVVSSAVAAALYGISLAVGGVGSHELWGNRTFAQFALLGLCWFLAGWRCRCRYSLPGAVLMTTLIALSLSRTAFAVAILLFFVTRFAGTSWKRLALVGPASVFFLGLMVVGVVRLIQPLNERFGGGQLGEGVLDGSSAEYTSGRVVIWTQPWQSAVESPWIGKGAGSASAYLADLYDGDIAHPHNDYLRILHDYGVVGLVLFLYGLARVGRLFWRNWAQPRELLQRRLSLAAALALTAIAMMMVTDNTLVYVFVMGPLGILLGTALGVRGLPDRIAAERGVREGSPVEIHA